MKQRTQKYLHAILALVLSLCLITGCSLFPNSTPEAEKNTVLETTAKAAGNGSLEDPAAQPDKTALLAAQKAFDQFTENLFKQEAAQSLLTLHYTLADPENYGITDYDRTLGTALAEDTRRDMEDAKQVKADLDAMDTRLLSKDQLLTYTILSSYINTLLSSDGLELYDQPLSTTLGIQSQLPILLSEYTFYKKQDIDDYRESPALRVIDELEKVGADVSYFDPWVPQCKHAGKVLQSIPALTPETVHEADLVMVTCAHTNVDYAMVQQNAKAVFDTKNVMKDIANRENIEVL